MATSTKRKSSGRSTGKKKKRTTFSLSKWWRKSWRKCRPWLIGFLVLAIGYLLLPYVTNMLFGGRRTETSNYDGIDISKHQGRIDWETVAQDKDIKFVYIKATEGSSVVDKLYAKNVREARAAGLKVGSYHFFRGYKTASEQFEIFKKYVKKKEQDLIPMVDVEETGNRYVERNRLQKNLQEFMELVKREYGKYPLLYSQYHFYNERLAPEFNKYFIFIARYGKEEPTLKGGGKYNIWQFSERGKIKGVKGTVDLDRFGPGTRLSDIEL
jgi:lysozyme